MKVYRFLRKAGYSRRWAFKAARIARRECGVELPAVTDLTPGPRQGKVKVTVTPPAYRPNRSRYPRSKPTRSNNP